MPPPIHNRTEIMGSRQPFLAQDSFFDDPERANSMQGNGNNLHLIVSNEAFEYVDEDDYDDACWSCCTPWRILVGLGLFALFGLMAVTWYVMPEKSSRKGLVLTSC